MFSYEIPSGLPPIRGIKYHIYLVLSATTSNRPTYQSNFKKIRKLQRQVQKLMSKGYIIEKIESIYYFSINYA